MQVVYLSRRNLLTLLNKLDRVKAGGRSRRCLIKPRVETDPYINSDSITVYALEDEELYSNREAGEVHYKDQPY